MDTNFSEQSPNTGVLSAPTMVSSQSVGETSEPQSHQNDHSSEPGSGHEPSHSSDRETTSAQSGHSETDSSPKEYTIDDLAAVTRVPSRTIRFYQSKGVIQKPQLRGRIAYYTEAHVERLKLVAELQDRGLQIKAIGDIVARLDRGELALHEWLGVEDQLKEPWAADLPKVCDTNELRSLAGDGPGRIAELIRAGLVERRGEAFLIPSPALLQVAVRLEASGFGLDASVEAGGLMRRHLNKAVRELVDFFMKHADDVLNNDDGTSLIEMVRTLRPTAMEALRVIFAQEIEREIRQRIETGQTAKLGRKAKR